MELLQWIIIDLRVAALIFFLWYLAERCMALYNARKLRARRRYEFQKVWRASTAYGDELDYIITREDNI